MKKAQRLQPMWSAEAVVGLTPEEKLVVALISHAVYLACPPDRGLDDAGDLDRYCQWTAAVSEASGHEGLTAGEWARLWLEDESHEPWSLNWCVVKLREAMGDLDPDKIRVNARRGYERGS